MGAGKESGVLLISTAAGASYPGFPLGPRQLGILSHRLSELAGRPEKSRGAKGAKLAGPPIRLSRPIWLS